MGTAVDVWKAQTFVLPKGSLAMFSPALAGENVVHVEKWGYFTRHRFSARRFNGYEPGQYFGLSLGN